ncbi:unnamed protein product, partial [Urochloa humidicola]
TLASTALLTTPPPLCHQTLASGLSGHQIRPPAATLASTSDRDLRPPPLLRNPNMLILRIQLSLPDAPPSILSDGSRRRSGGSPVTATPLLLLRLVLRRLHPSPPRRARDALRHKVHDALLSYSLSASQDPRHDGRFLNFRTWKSCII